MLRVCLIAIIAAMVAGAAVAQERSTSPVAGEAEKSAPPLNATQGSPSSQDNVPTGKATRDRNANPDAAIGRGEIDESSVQSLLQARGYNDVRDLKRSGEAFTATANKDNRDVRVSVDARTGQIREARP